MEPFRFIHTADLHLDSPFRGISEIAPDLKNRLQEATFLAFQNIVDLCLEREVDALLIAGDIHDAADRSLRSLTRLRDQFLRLADRNIGVFLCHGNHDPLMGWEEKFSWPDNVHVFGSDQVESKPLIRRGAMLAQVYGISYGEELVKKNLVPYFKKEASTPWAIGLLHTNVGQDPNHLNYAPCELHDLVQAGMDYWALGHIHAHRVLKEIDPLIVYPGNPQGRHPRETGPHGCYLVEVDHQGLPQYQFIPVDVVRWYQETLSIEGVATLQELLSKMEEQTKVLHQESGQRGGIVRWKLIGRGPLHQELVQPGRGEDLLATLRERSQVGSSFMWAESIQDITGRDVDVGELRHEENLLGDFLRLTVRDDTEMLSEVRQSLKILLDDPRLRRFLEAPDDDGIRQLIHAAEREGIDRLFQDEE